MAGNSINNRFSGSEVMNTLTEILLTIGATIVIGFVLASMSNILSSKFFYPILSWSGKFIGHKNKKDFEATYLKYVADISKEALATRESANVSPKLKLQEIYVMPFLSDEGGSCFKFSTKFILESNTQNFLIIGNAGSGKTSLLRHIQLQISSESLDAENSSDRILPFYISLREFQGQIKTTLAALLEERTALLEERTPLLVRKNLREKYIEESLNNGRILMLLDGLDEIKNERDAHEIMKSITQWGQMYETCKFIVTSRPNRLEELDIPNLFKRFSLLPFSDGQITEFLRKWTNHVFEDLLDVFEDPSSYQQNRLILRRLALENAIMSRPALKDLAANPLMLTLMCTTHYFTGSIPNSRTFIFQESIGLLLNKVNSNIPKHHLIFVIEQIAFDYQTYHITVSDKNYVHKSIEKSKRIFSIDFSTENILNELIERSGLLYERLPNQVSFVHYSFQEFFAARYIIDSGMEVSGLKDFLNDQWWRNVLLLSAEMMPSIGELCSDILKDKNLPDIDKVQLVGQILASSTKADREEKIKIVQEVVSEILEDKSDEYKQQMLLLASPHISSEIILIIGDGDNGQ